jgi:hypothetical protein
LSDILVGTAGWTCFPVTGSITVSKSNPCMDSPRSGTQLLGKTDFNVWPRFLAEHYVKDDDRVMGTSVPIVNRIELIFRPDRSTDWFSTTNEGLSSEVYGCARYEIADSLKAGLPPESRPVNPSKSEQTIL